MSNNNINISPIISPDIIDNLSKSKDIKSFGNQTKNPVNEKLIIGNQGKTKEIEDKQNELDQQEKQAGINLKNKIENTNYQYNTKQITQEQYNQIIENAQVSYNSEIAIIKVEEQKLEQNKNNIINNPFQNIKDKQKQLNNKIKVLKKQNLNLDSKAKKDLIKQVLSNASKTLAPVIALQLVNSFTSIISQRKQLEDLVDQVNDYIDNQVIDQTTVVIATNLRNSAVTLINNNVKKLQTLEKTLKTITTIINVINTILTTIERILNLPIPALLPIKVQLQPTLQRILKLISAVNAVLVIASNLLENEILKLIEIRERLKQIDLKLDTKTLSSLDNQEFTELVNIFIPVGTEKFLSYKGFSFKLKEENNPRFIVKGNKRRYAVAIDSNGVEVLKSEFSFTLDPNDLIEQLKLVIDQQNLQG